MASKTVKVGSSVGLHARPAAVISQEAAKLSSTVTLAAEGGEPIDAKSVLLIMTLGASAGDPVTVAGDNEDDVNTIADLVASSLHDGAAAIVTRPHRHQCRTSKSGHRSGVDAVVRSVNEGSLVRT